MARLIDNLDLLVKGQMAALKRICGVDDEDLADMIRELRAYDPKPGCRFADEGRRRASRPTCSSGALRSGYAVELNSATLPRLLVNRRYYQRAQERPAGQGVEGLAERMPRQRQLAGQGARPARADDRQGRVARSSSGSRASSSSGVSSLKPLTLREVGEAIEMHESTVSRVTSNKYLLCDRGLFELKYFFGSGVGSSDEGGEGGARPKRSRRRSAN